MSCTDSLLTFHHLIPFQYFRAFGDLDLDFLVVSLRPLSLVPVSLVSLVSLLSLETSDHAAEKFDFDTVTLRDRDRPCDPRDLTDLDLNDCPVSSCVRWRTWMSNLASKLGQIGPKWEKYGTFLDQISVHLEPRGFVTFCANLTHFGAKTNNSVSQITE